MEKHRECDVFVVGGTLEGCVAALEAARNGKKAILIEKSGSLGGMATNGLHALMEKAEDGKSARLRMEILDRLGLPAVDEEAIYPDQRLKVVLGEMLRESGVEWYTHVFVSSPISDDAGRITGFRANGKTDPFSIYAGLSVDATPAIETAGMCGVAIKETSRRVAISVKVNEYDMAELGLEDKVIVNGGIKGRLQADYSESISGMKMSCSNPVVLIRPDSGEMIIEDLQCGIPDSGILSLSGATMRLRRFAYSFRDYLRGNANGMKNLNIIHVAPFLSTYGLRVVDREPDGTAYLNNDGLAYTNSRAIQKGLQAVSK